MAEIPEGLTPELLGFVLGLKDLENSSLKIVDNKLYIFYDDKTSVESINIDTLTRLMKDKLRELGYVVSICHHLDTVAVRVSSGGKRGADYWSPSMSVYTEFEAVLEAVSWVANNG